MKKKSWWHLVRQKCLQCGGETILQDSYFNKNWELQYFFFCSSCNQEVILTISSFSLSHIARRTDKAMNILASEQARAASVRQKTLSPPSFEERLTGDDEAFLRILRINPKGVVNQ